MCLQSFRGVDRLPSLCVNRSEIFQHHIRIHAAITQHLLDSWNIVANKTQLEHGRNNVMELSGVCTCAAQLVRSLTTSSEPERPNHVHASVSNNGGKDLPVLAPRPSIKDAGNTCKQDVSPIESRAVVKV